MDNIGSLCETLHACWPCDERNAVAGGLGVEMLFPVMLEVLIEGSLFV